MCEFAVPTPSGPLKVGTGHHGWIQARSRFTVNGEEPMVRCRVRRPRIDWPWTRQILGVARERRLTGASARACSLPDRQLNAGEVGNLPDQQQQRERQRNRFNHGAHESFVFKVDSTALAPRRGVRVVGYKIRRGEQKEVRDDIVRNRRIPRNSWRRLR